MVVDVSNGRDAVLARVLTDYAAHRPAAVTLLSGGAGSRRLQALWNGLIPGPGLPSSYSLAVDAPHCWSDTDDALNAAHDLGTSHTLVAAEVFPDALCSAVAATGETPPDEMTPYFAQLGSALREEGISAVLAGDGNDALLSPARGGLLRRLGLLAPATADARAVLDRAALRSVILQSAGVDLLCPYLDSRVLRLAIAPPTAQPRWLPPAHWLAPGGCLRPFIERLDEYPEINRSILGTGGLFRLVCCDIWRKHFAAGFVPQRPDGISSPAIRVRAA
jgi:hypothetical protein